MVKTTLVEKDIQEGKRILTALDKRGLQISAALWLYFSGNEEWKFTIAVPMIKREGPIKTYRFIRSVLAALRPPLKQVSLENITAVKPENEIIQVLKVAIHTGPGIHGIRFTRNVINGLLIDDAYIYRML
jgi:hypothetical protein